MQRIIGLVWVRPAAHTGPAQSVWRVRSECSVTSKLTRLLKTTDEMWPVALGQWVLAILEWIQAEERIKVKKFSLSFFHFQSDKNASDSIELLLNHKMTCKCSQRVKLSTLWWQTTLEVNKILNLKSFSKIYSPLSVTFWSPLQLLWACNVYNCHKIIIHITKSH